MNRRLACTMVVGSVLLSAASISGCGPTRERHAENRYDAVTWSPDGTEVAYLKWYVEYVVVKPRISLFVGEDTKRESIERQELFLCVNDVDGRSERVLDEIRLPGNQEDAGISTNIEWTNSHIRYGAEVQGAFSTGVIQISPQGDQKLLVEPSVVGVTGLRPTLTNADDQELYGGFGDYGFFGYRTIYLFDHKRRRTRVFLHDPLSDEAPFVPPYSVTGR